MFLLFSFLVCVSVYCLLYCVWTWTMGMVFIIDIYLLLAAHKRILALYYNLPKSQINRLQQIQNCFARTVVKAPKSSHITPILWLKINERIEYKLLSLIYTKFLQPANLTTYTILSLFSLQVELALRRLSP